jgi:hypothetical protein
MLAFMIVRWVIGLIGFGPAPDAKDVEIAVRHQLMVVWSTAGRSHGRGVGDQVIP